MPATHPVAVEVLTVSAEVAATAGHLEQAREHLRDALDAQRKRLGPEHLALISTLARLAEFHRALGEYAAAGSTLDEALKLQGNATQPDPRTVAQLLAERARLLTELKRYDEARNDYEKAITRLGQFRSESDRSTTAGLIRNLAGLHMMRGDYGAAQPLVAKAKAMTSE